MKLVNIHKLKVFIVVLFIGIFKTNAQVWTVQQCIDSAIVNNKNLQINRNNLALGIDKQKEAKANLLPKISANAEYKYFIDLPYQLLPLSTFNPTAPKDQFKEAQFGVPHNINANLQLMMPLYNPQVYGAIQTTKIASELTKLQYKKTEEQLFFEISNLYYNAQILQNQMVFIDTNLINAKRLLRNMQLLNQQLLAKGTDVNKIKLQVAQLENQKINTSSNYTQVLNALKFAMGINLSQQFDIETKIIYQESKSYETVNTLDMQVVQTQNKLLKTDLKTLNQSRFIPTVNFIATYGTTGFGYDKSPNNFLNFYPLGFAGVQMSYPIFNGTLTLHKLKQKKLELVNNEIQYELISEQNKLQIENVKLQLNSAKSSINTNEIQIALAQEIYQQTVIQQKQGIASLTDILLADNALREAQQNYLNALVAYLKADLEMKKLNNQFSNKN
jgi:outer membrane protein TolC